MKSCLVAVIGWLSSCFIRYLADMVIHLLQQTYLDSLLNPMGDLEQLAKEPAMQVRVLGAGCAQGAAQSTWTSCKVTVLAQATRHRWRPAPAAPPAPQGGKSISDSETYPQVLGCSFGAQHMTAAAQASAA